MVIVAGTVGTYFLALSNNSEPGSTSRTEPLTLTLKPGDSSNYTVTTYENGTITAV